MTTQLTDEERKRYEMCIRDRYVNDWTINLGETGAAAFSALREKAISANLITAESPRLEIAAG